MYIFWDMYTYNTYIRTQMFRAQKEQMQMSNTGMLLTGTQLSRMLVVLSLDQAICSCPCATDANNWCDSTPQLYCLRSTRHSSPHKSIEILDPELAQSLQALH